ncbi:MAG: AmmeMemoRadiSam system protein B [Candidatus Gracilibacteria bacterium]
MFKFSKFILASTLLLSFFGCQTSASNVLSGSSTFPQNIRGFIVPHHLLVEPYIDTFYQEIGNTIDANSIERIILLSPNHFNYGWSTIQTTDQGIDLDAIALITQTGPIHIEPEKFSLEHGITVEEPFLVSTFPNAKLLPLIIKTNTPQERIDLALEKLLQLDLSHTIIVGSLDFTHYTSEETALKNDERMVNFFENLNNETITLDTIKTLATSFDLDQTPDGLAVDSPETLYFFLRLMQSQNALDFTLWKRTSSASLLNNSDPTQNTSHLFGTFY